MRCRRLVFSFALVAVGVCFSFAAGPAQAVGYWNLPGNYCQWCGYGYGPGYHAPMILGPISHDGEWHHRVVRMPYAPQPQYSDYGCMGGGCDQSWLNGSSPSPVVEPVSEPSPAAFRPQMLQ